MYNILMNNNTLGPPETTISVLEHYTNGGVVLSREGAIMLKRIKNYILNKRLNGALLSILMSEYFDDSVEYEVLLPFGEKWYGTWHDAMMTYGEKVYK